MDKSVENWNKQRTQEKLESIEKNIIDIKIALDRIERKVDKINKKTPTRAAGWFGDYKTYED
tara:strand:+ start:584 stop:769 length:186 start_codon:yes stop_codon:yes gene_type:complete